MPKGHTSQKAALSCEVSPAVIRRLPRYFRFLREAIRLGKTRLSSSELSEMMQVTASQIRQDLNCFGGFGQQGYGYNVLHLYTKIGEILGVGEGFRAAVIGAGKLGTALVSSPMFENRGVDVVAMFDVSPDIIGKTYGGHIKVFPMEKMEELLEEYLVDIVILTLPKDQVPKVAARLEKTNVDGIWNFTGIETVFQTSEKHVKNVHIGDSLMTLCYEIAEERRRVEKDG